MDKKLKKKTETHLVITIQDILSRINTAASTASKKKIREAGKMVAKKFAKEVASIRKKSTVSGAPKKDAKKKSVKKNSQPKRDSHGRFQKKKK